MKRSEIEVGHEYAAGRSQDWMRWLNCTRVRIVDLGPFVQASQFAPRRLDLGVIDGTPTVDNYRREAKGSYVAVREYDRDGNLPERIRFLHVSHLKVTWDEYLETATMIRAREKEARERQKQQEDADHAERVELRASATRAGVALDFITKPGKVIISRDDLRRLLDAALVTTEPLDGD